MAGSDVLAKFEEITDNIKALAGDVFALKEKVAELSAIVYVDFSPPTEEDVEWATKKESE